MTGTRKHINFTFIFKSGKVSKITVSLDESEVESILNRISKLDGKLELVSKKPRNVFIVDLGECSAVEYSIYETNNN